MRRVLALALLFLFVAGCGVRSRQLPPYAQEPPPAQTGSGSQTSEVPKPVAGAQPGLRAPSIAAVDVATGQPVSLSDLRGHVVMLNFFATWCLPCRNEMPAMEKIQREMGTTVKVVSIGFSDFEAPKQLKAFTDGLGVTFPVLFDEGAAGTKYRVVGLPTSFFIDQEGVVRVRVPGEMTEALIRKHILETSKGGR